MTVANVVKCVFDRAVATTGAGSFHESVGGRVYHLEAPEQSALPLCVFGLADNAEVDRRFSGDMHERYLFQFDIWVSNEVTGGTPDATACDIDEKLFRQIDGQILTATNYDRITVLAVNRGQPVKDSDAVRITSQYEAKGNRTT